VGKREWSSPETQEHAKNLSSRQKKNRRRCPSTLGEVPGGEVEIDGIGSSGACCEDAAGFGALIAVYAG
jgi:hypothetical protein